LRVARQLGYKNVADTVKNIGKGLGSVQPEHGNSWFAGI